MEIVFAVIGVILVGYLFWQSYLLSQYKKIVDDKNKVIAKLARQIDTLKPFQVLIATLRGGNFLLDQNFYNDWIKVFKNRSPVFPNVSGQVYNRTMKKRKPPLNKVAQATRNAHSAELFRSLLLNKHIVATPATRKGSRKSNIIKAIKEYN